MSDRPRLSSAHIPRTRPPAPVLLNIRAIDAWNAAIVRARLEYRAHPFAGSCYDGHRCLWRRGIRR